MMPARVVTFSDIHLQLFWNRLAEQGVYPCKVHTAAVGDLFKPSFPEAGAPHAGSNLAPGSCEYRQPDLGRNLMKRQSWIPFAVGGAMLSLLLGACDNNSEPETPPAGSPPAETSPPANQ